MATIVKYILDIETGKSKSDIKKTEKAVDGLNKDLKKTEIQGKKSAGALAKMGKALGTVGVGVAAVGVLALGLKRAAEASYDFAKASVDSVNQLNDIAVKSGISAQGVQAIIQAFEGSGQAAGAADAFMSRLPQTFAAIATAGTRSSKVAKGLGIALTDASGEALSSDQIMVNLTDKFQSIEDPTKRATAAFLLFGRSAGSFLQAFGATSEFEKFLGFAEKFGVKTGPEASAEAAAFQEQLAALSIVSKGTFQTIATGTGVVGIFSSVLLKTGKSLAFVQAFMVEGADTFETYGKWIKFITDRFSNLGTMIATVVSPNLGFILKTMGLIESATKEVTGVSIGGVTSDAFVDITGFKSAVEAGESASIEYGEMIEDLLKKLEIDGEKAQLAQDQLEALLKDLQGINEDVGAGEVKPEDTSDRDNAIKLLDDYIAKSKIITERDQLRATFEALSKEIVNAAEEGNDLIKGMDALDIATDEYILSVAALNQELDNLENNKAAEKQAEAFAKLGDQITRAGDGLSSLLTGDISGFMRGITPQIEKGLKSAISGISKSIGGSGDGAALATSLVAPVVGAIKSVFSAASQIGQAGLIDPETGERATDERARFLAVESVETKMRNQARAIEIGLQVLPEILLEVLPGIFQEFGQMLVETLISLPRLFAEAMQSALNEALPDVFSDPNEGQKPNGKSEAFLATRRMREDAGKSTLGSGRLIEDFKKAFSFLGLESGGRLQFAESGLRFTGESTGMAVLHPGEFVVPRTGQAPQNVQRDFGSQSGGGGMTINITGDLIESTAVDELVRRIENRFLSFGGGSSPLFGGA
jgi:hypothetical protein